MQSISFILVGLITYSMILSTLLGSPIQPPFLAHSYAKVVGRDQPSKPEDDRNAVSFTNCHPQDYKIHGKVDSMTITPCERPSGSKRACTFVHGRNYTIELNFLTTLHADHPRSSIVAGDPKLGPYAYSGQSFAACKYTDCPIMANVPSTYVYHFQTLASSFDYLTFNVTQDFFGPSLFCAGTKIKFQPNHQ